MVPRILYLHPKAYKRLIRLRKQAERDGAYRVAKRLQAVVLNSKGRTSGELAHLLGSPRSRVSEWLAQRWPTESGLCSGIFVQDPFRPWVPNYYSISFDSSGRVMEKYFYSSP